MVEGDRGGRRNCYFLILSIEGSLFTHSGSEDKDVHIEVGYSLP